MICASTSPVCRHEKRYQTQEKTSGNTPAESIFLTADAESDLYILLSSQETLKQQNNFYILHSDKLHLINIKTPPALKFPVD